MDMLMLPGYIQVADIDTAIVALQFELTDIEELISSATGDSASAFRSRRNDIQQSLQVLRDRKVGLRQDPRGAATAAALQHLPPQRARRPVTRPVATPARP